MRVDAVIKGDVLTGDLLVFRHYGVYPAELSGPPGEPAKRGHRGLYFLRRGPNGSTRALVDEANPYIDMKWVKSPRASGCVYPARECLVDLLISFQAGDDIRDFARALPGAVAHSSVMVGDFQVLRKLQDLLSRSEDDAAKRAYCATLARSYALATPSVCFARLSPSEALEMREIIDRISAEADVRGAMWLERYLGINGAAQRQEYRSYMLRSGSEKVLTLARKL